MPASGLTTRRLLRVRVRRLALAAACILLAASASLTASAAVGGQAPVNREAELGRNGYVEYLPGDLPIVLSVPHGGDLRPDEIPDRVHEITEDDWGSLDFARQVSAEIERLTGRQPYMIINHLARIKMDPNRPLAEAASGNPWAEEAWREYHGFIDQAEAGVVDGCGAGHYFDLHSNGQEGFLIQLGFGLTLAQLDQPDKGLDRASMAAASSLRRLAGQSGNYLSGLVRGDIGLGALLRARGYHVVPSPNEPAPEVEPYFNGGYSIWAHGSRTLGWVDATQVEVTYDLLRPNFRTRLARSLAEAMVRFVDERYGYRMTDPAATAICPTFADLPFSDPASPVVERLVRQGLADACADGPRRLCPASPITRAELAVMLEGAYDLRSHDAEPTAPTPFADLAGLPSAALIRAAWGHDLVEPCSLDPLRFCPGGQVTRAQAVLWAWRLAGLKPGPTPAEPTFADVPGSNPNLGPIESAYQIAWIGACGSSPRRFCPDSPVSRAEAIAITAGAMLTRLDWLGSKADR